MYVGTHVENLVTRDHMENLVTRDQFDEAKDGKRVCVITYIRVRVRKGCKELWEEEREDKWEKRGVIKNKSTHTLSLSERQRGVAVIMASIIEEGGEREEEEEEEEEEQGRKSIGGGFTGQLMS